MKYIIVLISSLSIAHISYSAEKWNKKILKYKDNLSLALLRAVQQQKTAKTQRILKAFVDPDYFDEHGQTALHLVLCRDWIPHKPARVGIQCFHLFKVAFIVISHLVKHKPENLNAQDCYGCTPLFYAVRKNNDNAVAALLTIKANPEIASYHSNVTPLWIACKEGFKDLTDRLLDAQANPNAVDLQNCSCLCIAAQHQRWDTIDLLLAENADPNIFPHHDIAQSALQSILNASFAPEQTKLKFVKKLLRRGAITPPVLTLSAENLKLLEQAKKSLSPEQRD
jgi:hypothetical protein